MGDVALIYSLDSLLDSLFESQHRIYVLGSGCSQTFFWLLNSNISVSTDFCLETTQDHVPFPAVETFFLWIKERSAVRKAARVATTPVWMTSDMVCAALMAAAAYEPVHMPSRKVFLGDGNSRTPAQLTNRLTPHIDQSAYAQISLDEFSQLANNQQTKSQHRCAFSFSKSSHDIDEGCEPREENLNG